MKAITKSNQGSEIDLDENLGYGKLWSTLARRRNWFLGILGGALAVATFSAVTQEPVYESSFQLLIESVYRSKEKNVYEDLNVEVENYATQLEIMRSSQLLDKARQALEGEYPNLELKDIEDNFEIAQVQGDDYEDDRVKTTVFEAEYTDDDPRKTQRVLETIVRVYQEYTLEQQQARLAQGLSFIDNQLPIARQKVREAENALENFRKTHNLINPVQRANDVTADLKDVRAQMRQVKVNYQNASAQYQAWQERLERNPQQASVAARLSQSPRYASLLEAVQKTELALNARKARFKSTDPMVQSLQQQLADERSMLKTEAEAILGRVPENLELTEVKLLGEGQLGENDLEATSQLSKLKVQLDALKAQERGLIAAERELQTQLDRFPNLIAEYNRLKPGVEVKQATVQQLLSARQKLSIEIDRGGLKWQVVEAPALGEDETPSKLKTILLGGIVGSFLGIGAALGKDMLDDAIHTPQQLEQESALALLGVIPKLPDSSLNQENSQLLLTQFKDRDRSIEQAVYLRPLRESLDLIYQNIKQLGGDRGKSLLVTSIESGVDSLTLMLGLASSAIRTGNKVLLVDSNFRFPSLHQKLGVDGEFGLSEFIAGARDNPTIETVSLLNEPVDVLTAGSQVSDPVKLLSSSRLQELIIDLEFSYDLILFNSPALLGYVDMLQTAQCCQGVVLVEKIDRITKSKLAEAKAILNQLNVIGIVADGGEASEAKLQEIYQPQWESMFRQLPPVNTQSTAKSQ